jgi:hypothetical protein
MRGAWFGEFGTMAVYAAGGKEREAEDEKEGQAERVRRKRRRRRPDEI